MSIHNRIKFLAALSAFGLLLTAAIFQPSASEPQRMNVLFIISDDLRAETGSYGGKAITPNIDKLAEQGVQFDRAYCQYPLCNPSRTSMLFGRHVTTTQLYSNREWIADRHPDWLSLPRWFKQHGYTTMRAGKVFHGGIDDTEAWNEGGEKRRHGNGPKPEPEGSTMQPRPKNSATADMTKQQRSDRWTILDTPNGEGYGDYMVADLTIDYLQRIKNSKDPWFIACGFSKPHSPLEAPKRFFDLYNINDIELTPDFSPAVTVPKGFPAGSIRPQNADLFIGREATPDQARQMILAYLAASSWMDWNTGRVLGVLDSLGLRDNTIVVFWGDHGYQLGEKGKWSKAGSLWEQGCRVPTIIHDPRAKGNGQNSPRIVQSIDFYPTLADLCGLPLPDGLDGLSLSPLLADPQATWDHPAYTVWSENGSTANSMVVQNATLTGVSVRTERWHYAEFFGRGAGAMLLDPLNDPYEIRNLAGDPAYADAVRELSGLINSFAGRLTAPGKP
jgi:arylsulfatase A-like enzyme